MNSWPHLPSVGITDMLTTKPWLSVYISESQFFPLKIGMAISIQVTAASAPGLSNQANAPTIILIVFFPVFSFFAFAFFALAFSKQLCVEGDEKWQEL